MPRSQTPFPLSALPVLVRTFARVVLPLPTLVAGRAYVGLLRDRTHLETSGPGSSARPPPPRRNRQGRRSRPTIGYDRGGSPAPTRGAALAGLVRLPTQQAPLRYGNPCSARGARCHCARPLTFGTGSSTRLLPRSRLDTRTPPAGLRQPCYYTRGARRPAPLTSGPCSGGTRLTCSARCRASRTTSPPRSAAARLPRAGPARPTRVARHAGSGGSGSSDARFACSARHPPPMCCNLIARVDVGPHPGSSRPSRLHAGAPLGLRSRWPMPNPLYRRWYGASTSPDCRPGLFYQAAK